MAMGVPVFAINDGAVPEIISHQENGILLDTVDQKIIAQQIFKVLEDNKLIDNIKKRCIEDVHSKFSIELCVNQIEKIYEEVFK
jgi:glycosyltransferase involved in cell wall biosynthesis